MHFLLPREIKYQYLTWHTLGARAFFAGRVQNLSRAYRQDKLTGTKQTWVI